MRCILCAPHACICVMTMPLLANMLSIVVASALASLRQLLIFDKPQSRASSAREVNDQAGVKQLYDPCMY